MANFLEGKKYHILYKTTNLSSSRYYIGMHSTNELGDGYIGSGKRLWYEIRKYGRENFKFEILGFFNTREELAQKERELITEIEVKDSNCMNLKVGGIGGFPPNAKPAFKEKLKDPEFRKKYSETHRQRMLKEYREGIRKPNLPNWTGKKHRPETIQKMKDVKKGCGVGEKNSQFGSFWITNGKINKKTRSEIPKGWYRGRVF